MIDFLLAISPILLLIIFLFGIRWPLFKAAPVSFVYSAIVAMLIWALPISGLVAALLKGMLLSLDIMLIVFGAIFFLKYLQREGSILKMENSLKALSSLLWCQQTCGRGARQLQEFFYLTCFTTRYLQVTSKPRTENKVRPNPCRNGASIIR